MADLNLDSGSLFESVKANVAYCLCRELSNSEAFVWTCGGFRGLSENKANLLHSENAGETARTLRSDV